MESRAREAGHGLNESLCVVAIISVMMLVVMALVKEGREAAAKAETKNQIHQMEIEKARQYLETKGM